MRKVSRLLLVGVGIALLGGLPATATPAYAHGFGERYDLPVPLWLYVAGAGAAVAFSFVIIGFFLRRTPGLGDYPRLNLLRWRAGRVLVNSPLIALVKLASVFVFGVVIAAGLIGDSEPTDNLAPTLIWVIWWVGTAYVSALVGNVWALVNPWKITFQGAETLYRRLDSQGRLSFNLPYPKRLGVWPGVTLFLVFAWAEIVYSGSAEPVNIARMALVYSVITWGGMLLFGVEQWLRHGEAFSLAFGLLARFAPTELRVASTEVCDSCAVRCRDQAGRCVNCAYCFSRSATEHWELNLRPYAAGLLAQERVSLSVMVFVLLLLSTVTFDGFTATPTWADIQGSILTVVPSLTATSSLGLIVFPALFLGVYLLFSAFMAGAGGNKLPVQDIAQAFVYSLIPIALAYHLAHFLSFLLIQGQLIIPLASDPFGFGWNLFGTTDFRVDITVVNARFAWFTAAGAVVLGHIIAVYSAHVIALRSLRDRRAALMSQYPMLALMVGYTMVSLWILAQPIVET